MPPSRFRSHILSIMEKVRKAEEEDLFEILEAYKNPGMTKRRKVHFLDLPIEIHFRILDLICQLDTVSLSLTCRKFYTRLYPLTQSHDLSLSSGSPSSLTPHPNPTGCRHCVPVLYSPAHCELHYHIRCFFPPESSYCGNCDLFTPSERKELASDSKEICGRCGVPYRRRYARGRRFVDVKEGEVGRKRASRWFNVSG